MNDSEIIKAKEHFQYGISHDIFKEPVLSYAKTVLWAFEEINRQQAEIEKLSNCVVMQEKLIQEQILVMEHTGKMIIADGKIKSEAIKEFAERLKKALSEFDLSSVGLPDYDRGYSDCMTAVEDTFDNLVKEMVGDVE